MRNPDRWQLPERPGEPAQPADGGRRPSAEPGSSGAQAPATDSRRGAVIGLIIVSFLLAGGILLAVALKGMADLQDCSLSGRSNCQ